MNKVKVLIVDDNFVVRKGLRSLLEGVEGITVVGEAVTGTHAIEWLDKSSADVILMDIRMPGKNGIKTTAEIMLRRPEAKVLMLTLVDDPYVLAQSISSGARGCLVYNQFSPKELVQGIHTLASSDSIVVPPSVENILSDMARNSRSTKNPYAEIGATILTKREKEVFELAAEGKSNSEIAELLSLEKQTVKNHLRNAYSKLNIKNRYEAIHLKSKFKDF